MPVGFVNSFPEEARRRVLLSISCFTEKFGNSGGDKEGPSLESSLDSTGSQSGTKVHIWESATDAAVRVSCDRECKYGRTYKNYQRVILISLSIVLTLATTDISSAQAEGSSGELW